MTEEFEQIEGGDECVVLASKSVIGFLAGEKANSQKDVTRIGNILNRLGEFGPMHMNNSEQFKSEGKFPTGEKSGRKISVYAVKAFQIRVYGGFLKINGSHGFLCVEATKKKQNKANQAQLRRVARKLGEYND